MILPTSGVQNDDYRWFSKGCNLLISSLPFFADDEYSTITKKLSKILTKMLFNKSLLSVYASIMLIVGMGNHHCANAAPIVRKTKSDAVKKKTKTEATTTIAATTVAATTAAATTAAATTALVTLPTSGLTCPSECVLDGSTKICTRTNTYGKFADAGGDELLILISFGPPSSIRCIRNGGPSNGGTESSFPGTSLFNVCLQANADEAATGATKTAGSSPNPNSCPF